MKANFTTSLLIVFALADSLCGRAQTNYTIPVVFHILNQGGAENISDSQVYSGIKTLNTDFNKQNADTIEVIPAFANLIADVGVTFQLATIDPNGNATTGIDRITTPLCDTPNASCMINQWNPHHYLNIWTTQSGFMSAVLPATADSFPGLDGIVIISNYVGTVGTSSEFTSRVLTHQAGHYLNLLNIWGNTNTPGVTCGDDSIADTPITKGWTSCPTPADSAVCTPGVTENYQNYMDDSYCSIMFTPDQKARMVAALNSTIAHRNELYTMSNLIGTGIVSGIKNTVIENVTVYPNPFTNTIYVGGLSNKPYTINVEDVLGRTIESHTIPASNGTVANIDLSSINTPGVYLLRVFDGESTGTFKLIKN